MGASLTTGKTPTKTGFSYSIGWSTAVNRNATIVTANQIVQQWFAPKWNSASSAGYVNFFCQTAVSATNVTSQTFGILATTAELGLLSTNKTAAQTISAPVGTLITNTTLTQNSTWTTTAPWQSYNCLGARSDLDTTAGLTQGLKVGSSVSWNAGFKVYNNATANTTL